MKGAASFLILVLAVAALPVLPARAVPAISLSEYRQQLRDLRARVDALDAHPEDIAKTSASIPDEVVVNTSAKEVTVNYRDLKNDLSVLSRARAEKRPAGLRQIRDYLKTLDSEVESYGQPSDLNPAHQKLSAILARHEFQKVGGPSLRDLLLAKVFSWLNRMLNMLAAAGGMTVDWFSILIYAVITIAVSVLAVWTLRRLRQRGDEPVGREIIPFAPSARSWRVWLADARLMAQQQEWRNAIHLAYWAGISFLESGGAWKPNRARTPREYLRLMGSRKPEYPSLAALTRKFELVWYGDRTASALDFQEALGQLEKLGCR